MDAEQWTHIVVEDGNAFTMRPFLMESCLFAFGYGFYFPTVHGFVVTGEMQRGDLKDLQFVVQKLFY